MKRFSSFFVLYVFLVVSLALPPSSSAYYNNMSASVVVGQANFTGNSINQGGSVGANTLEVVYGVFTDGKKLLIGDYGNNRILIYNSIPTSNNASADVVIGQTNFTNSSLNQGGSAGANTLLSPTKPYTYGGKLFVDDYLNNRVLIFNQIPTTNNASADVVIGQPDMVTTSAGTSATIMKQPDGVTIDPATGKLIIADRGNNRVLIYNQVPTTNGASADVVLGQSSFSTNSTGSTASTFLLPLAVTVANGRLLVADYSNNRVLIWNSIPTTNGASADVVMGQTNMTNNSANQGGTIGANTLSGPGTATYDGKRLFVSDFGNNRILIYNSIPASNNASADIVIGQKDFTSGSSNQGGSVAANGFNGPGTQQITGNKMIMRDNSNNRLLIFSNQLPDTKLTNTIVSGIANGLERFQGTASTNVVNGVVKQVEYSVNGGSFTGALPSDGDFDEATEKYFFDFDPKSNNPDLTNNMGFTVRVRNTHSNDIDVSSSAFYFEPFNATTPQGIPTLLPTFSFSVNSWRFSDLSANLDRFRISVNKNNLGWSPYMDYIPVDYEKVRTSGDNLRASVVLTSGNGTYEDKFKTVTYTNNNGTIQVTPKAVDSSGNPSDKFREDGGGKLSAGSYQFKIEAIDRAGHIQETETRTLLVGGSRQIVISRSWFPLTISSLTGGGSSLDISTIHPTDSKTSYTTTTTPTIGGIATAGSIVTASFTNKICVARGRTTCTTTTTTTTGDNSRYTLSPPSPLLADNDYTLRLSVSDTGGNYNELPMVGVEVGSPSF